MSTSDEKKRVMEQHHFREFCRHLSDFSADEARSGHPPAPDFLITRPSGELGIELTSLSSDRRELEERRRMAVLTGQSIYQQNGNPDVIVGIHWLGDAFPEGVSTTLIGRKIARLVESAVQSLSGDSVDLEWGELKENGLDDVFDKIRVKMAPRGVRGHWFTPDAASISISAGADFIKKCVSKKEKKIPEYRKFCDEVWLLLVAEGTSISRTFDIESLSSLVLESNFDRIYLLDLFHSGDYSSVSISIEDHTPLQHMPSAPLFRLQLRTPPHSDIRRCSNVQLQCIDAKTG
ncbi:hypothetical protein [Melittangium boletus]|uniref:hypothetical protein n=1 Tax=Melittangium boletus TaxID=83453 RepID=UPI003DA38733